MYIYNSRGTNDKEQDMGVTHTHHHYPNRYHDHAGGVLLALSKLRLPKERRFASVMGDFPFLHLHVQAIALVFAPRPGLALEGRVIKVGRDGFWGGGQGREDALGVGVS